MILFLRVRRLAAVLVLVVSGCVHTQPERLGTAEGRAAVNARAEEQAAFVSVRGEGRQSVRSLRVGPDETTWIDRFSGAPRSAPTADVVSVSFRRGSVLRAAAVGVGIGAGLGLLTSLGDDGGLVSFSPAAYAAIFGLNGAFVGGTVGAFQTDRFDAGDAARLDAAHLDADRPLVLRRP